VEENKSENIANTGMGSGRQRVGGGEGGMVYRKKRASVRLKANEITKKKENYHEAWETVIKTSDGTSQVLADQLTGAEQR